MKSHKSYKNCSFFSLLSLFITIMFNVLSLEAHTTQVEQVALGCCENQKKQTQLNQIEFSILQNFKHATELSKKAQSDSQVVKISYLDEERIIKFLQNLNRNPHATPTIKAVLKDLVCLREEMRRFAYDRYALNEMIAAEKHFGMALDKAEEGKLLKSLTEARKAYQLYRRANMKWLKDGVLKKAKQDLGNLRDRLTPDDYRAKMHEIEDLKNILGFPDTLDIIRTRAYILDRIKDILDPYYPSFDKYLPDTLLIGDFVLIVETYYELGSVDYSRQEVLGISGDAWLHFLCDYSYSRVKGDMMKLIKLRRGILVHFDDVIIKTVPYRPGVGRIIQGRAYYPTRNSYPKIIRLEVLGFMVMIDTLFLTPDQAKANITLQFPKNLASGKMCKPASLYLGMTNITQKCEFYIERLSTEYGPFWIGNTEIIVEGKGFVADFSTAKRYSNMTPLPSESWQGLYLVEGHNLDEPSGSITSNRGYVKAPAKFSHAIITSKGFKGDFQLDNIDYSFSPLQPLGYQVVFVGGYYSIDKSEFTCGELNTCRIHLPQQAVCDTVDGAVYVLTNKLEIHPDGDLSGYLDFESGKYNEIFWGKLTNDNEEHISYSTKLDELGFFYLSSAYKPTFWPLAVTGFKSPILNVDLIFKQLDLLAIQGVTILEYNDFTIYTCDTPDSIPILIPGKVHDHSWLNVSAHGVHGLISADTIGDITIDIGPTHMDYYVAGVPFSTSFRIDKNNPIYVKFINSAVYGSEISGLIDLGGAANIKLQFKEMQFTSTANNAGAQVDLSIPETLEHWGIVLEQRPGFSSAGFVCVKTGQIILTAAGLSERRHFSDPFWLTWGEMLASGDIGRLFFDYYTGTQTFDMINFTPFVIGLSPYKTGVKGYLQVGGTIHFDFFGANYANIIDKKYNIQEDPYNGRLIELRNVQDTLICGTDTIIYYATDTTLNRNWIDDLGSFDFTISYDDADQDGFVGEGQVGINFILDGTMYASVVLSGRGNCISIHENSKHDFTLGPVAHFGCMSKIWGCACTEDGQLKRLMLGAELEATGNVNVLCRSAGYGKVTLVITPSIADLTVEGCMYITMIEGGDIEVHGQANFLVNYVANYVEGYLDGQIYLSQLLAGTEADGKLSWHLGPFGNEGYSSLQGYLKVGIATIIGGIEREGGFYIGINAPKEEAWILKGTNPRFAMDRIMNALPNRLTGIYGYVAWGDDISWGIFNGGIDLYAGLGGFVNCSGSAGLGSLILPVNSSFGGLPYMVGNVGIHLYGEICGGFVSAGAWGNLQLIFPYPFGLEGTLGLEGCVAWVVCKSVDLTVGLNSAGDYYYRW